MLNKSSCLYNNKKHTTSLKYSIFGTINNNIPQTKIMIDR